MARTPADLLPRVVEIVLESSAELLRAYRSGSGREVIRLKEGEKPVTAADLRVADQLARGLSALLPEAAFVSAEKVVPGIPGSCGPGIDVPGSCGPGIDGTCPTWFVDPIDGTRGFVDGGGDWTTSIGLAARGRPVLGAIAQPTLGRLWTAVAGGHAREAYPESGESRVLVRPLDGKGDLSRARLACSRTPRPEVAAVRGRCASSLEVGSTALKMAMVARGDADLFVGGGSAWDTCAGEAILRSAAGWASIASFDAWLLDYSPAARRHPRGVIAAVDPRTYTEAWTAAALARAGEPDDLYLESLGRSMAKEGS